MNPKEFSWSEDQQVTVINRSDKDYNFKVHNKDYLVKVGRTAKMPGYMAWVFVYGLATQLAQADGIFNRWNEEGFRQAYYDKLVIGSDAVLQEVQEVPQLDVVLLDDDLDTSAGPTEDEEFDPENLEDDEPTKEEIVKVAPMAANTKAKNGRSAKV